MERDEYYKIFSMLLECCDVKITRTGMSTRTGIILKVQWMNGELMIQITGGAMFPLSSVDVVRA